MSAAGRAADGVPPTAPPASTIQPLSITAPLLLWLLLQLSALALAAARVPLAARWPEPAEDIALHFMVAVQLTTSAMLFPWLLRDRWCVLAHILVAGPMLQLASLLSSAATSPFLSAWACVAAWLSMLALWQWIMPPRSLLRFVAGLNLLVLGGALLIYLGAASSQTLPWLRYFPLPAAIRVITGEPSPFIATIITLSLLPLFIRGYRTRRSHP